MTEKERLIATAEMFPVIARKLRETVVVTAKLIIKTYNAKIKIWDKNEDHSYFPVQGKGAEYEIVSLTDKGRHRLFYDPPNGGGEAFIVDSMKVPIEVAAAFIYDLTAGTFDALLEKPRGKW